MVESGEPAVVRTNCPGEPAVVESVVVVRTNCPVVRTNCPAVVRTNCPVH